MQGTWTVGPQEEGETGGLRRTVTESYKRLEYGGAPQGGNSVERKLAVTYAGKAVKICRKPAKVVDGKGEVKEGEGVYVYLKKKGADVQVASLCVLSCAFAVRLCPDLTSHLLLPGADPAVDGEGRAGTATLFLSACALSILIERM